MTSQVQVEKLKVPELKACLTFRGVPMPKQAKKADLVALLLMEIDLPVNACSPAPSGDDEEVDAAAFIDSSDEEDDSDSESEDEADLIM